MATETKAAKPAVKPAKAAKSVDTGARLRIQYNETIAKELVKELGLKNPHEAPKLEKVIVNV